MGHLMSEAVLIPLIVVAIPAVMLVTIPGWLLRQVVRVYPKGDPRRQELVAELRGVPFKERWFFVAQCLEVAVSEGMPSRYRSVRERRSTLSTPAGYAGHEASHIVGITRRQLDNWERSGLLHPSISQARGSRSQRRYSYTDLVQLKVIMRLLAAGVSPRAAKKAIDCLRSASANLASANLVTDESGSLLAYSGEEIIDLIQGGHTVLNVVPLGGIVSELAAAIVSLGLEAPTVINGERG